jgi:Bacterial capsule synthesis protein PGA_cap
MRPGILSALLAAVLSGVLAGPGIAQEMPVIPVAAIAPTAPDTRKSATESLTLVIGGDLGFGGSGQSPSDAGAKRHGSLIPFSDLTRGLRPLLTGDIVFANLETVVSDRSDLPIIDKAFNFNSHPSAVQHLLSVGLNAVSTANNHAADHGDAGLNETLRHLRSLQEAGALLAFPGIGLGRQAALAPHPVRVNGFTVNISAIGIGGGSLGVRESTTRPTIAHYGSAADMADSTTALKQAGGDVRMLSVHYGLEMQVRPSGADEQRLRAAAVAADAHIIAGHHAHVAAGVQQTDGRFIFYGLGNLLHAGMQDMGRHGICRDYGVLARVHLARRAQRFEVSAIEATTLADMHAVVRPRIGDDGRLRIAVLNYLAAGLDRPGTASGVRFMAREDGTGLWCAAGAERLGGAIGIMCQGHAEPSAPSAELTRRIATSCSGEPTARSRPEPAEKVIPASVPSRAKAADWRDAVLKEAR